MDLGLDAQLVQGRSHPEEVPPDFTLPEATMGSQRGGVGQE